MAVTEAHTRASVKYNKGRDNIMIRPTKEEGQQIRQAAADAGQSVQQYILDTLRKRRGAEEGEKTVWALERPHGFYMVRSSLLFVNTETVCYYDRGSFQTLVFYFLKSGAENFCCSVGVLVLLDELYQFLVLVGTETHKVLFVGL
jgi:hypothetical protein